MAKRLTAKSRLMLTLRNGKIYEEIKQKINALTSINQEKKDSLNDILNNSVQTIKEGVEAIEDCDDSQASLVGLELVKEILGIAIDNNEFDAELLEVFCKTINDKLDDTEFLDSDFIRTDVENVCRQLVFQHNAHNANNVKGLLTYFNLLVEAVNQQQAANQQQNPPQNVNQQVVPVNDFMQKDIQNIQKYFLLLLHANTLDQTALPLSTLIQQLEKLLLSSEAEDIGIVNNMFELYYEAIRSMTPFPTLGDCNPVINAINTLADNNNNNQALRQRNDELRQYILQTLIAYNKVTLSQATVNNIFNEVDYKPALETLLVNIAEGKSPYSLSSGDIANIIYAQRQHGDIINKQRYRERLQAFATTDVFIQQSLVNAITLGTGNKDAFVGYIKVLSSLYLPEQEASFLDLCTRICCHKPSLQNSLKYIEEAVNNQQNNALITSIKLNVFATEMSRYSSIGSYDFLANRTNKKILQYFNEIGLSYEDLWKNNAKDMLELCNIMDVKASGFIPYLSSGEKINIKQIINSNSNKSLSFKNKETLLSFFYTSGYAFNRLVSDAFRQDIVDQNRKITSAEVLAFLLGKKTDQDILDADGVLRKLCFQNNDENENKTWTKALYDDNQFKEIIVKIIAKEVAEGRLIYNKIKSSVDLIVIINEVFIHDNDNAKRLLSQQGFTDASKAVTGDNIVALMDSLSSLPQPVSNILYDLYPETIASSINKTLKEEDPFAEYLGSFLPSSIITFFNKLDQPRKTALVFNMAFNFAPMLNSLAVLNALKNQNVISDADITVCRLKLIQECVNNGKPAFGEIINNPVAQDDIALIQATLMGINDPAKVASFVMNNFNSLYPIGFPSIGNAIIERIDLQSNSAGMFAPLITQYFKSKFMQAQYPSFEQACLDFGFLRNDHKIAYSCFNAFDDNTLKNIFTNMNQVELLQFFESVSPFSASSRYMNLLQRNQQEIVCEYYAKQPSSFENILILSGSSTQTAITQYTNRLNLLTASDEMINNVIGNIGGLIGVCSLTTNHVKTIVDAIGLLADQALRRKVASALIMHLNVINNDVFKHSAHITKLLEFSDVNAINSFVAASPFDFKLFPVSRINDISQESFKKITANLQSDPFNFAQYFKNNIQIIIEKLIALYPNILPFSYSPDSARLSNLAIFIKDQSTVILDAIKSGKLKIDDVQAEWLTNPPVEICNKDALNHARNDITVQNVTGALSSNDFNTNLNTLKSTLSEEQALQTLSRLVVENIINNNASNVFNDQNNPNISESYKNNFIDPTHFPVFMESVLSVGDDTLKSNVFNVLINTQHNSMGFLKQAIKFYLASTDEPNFELLNRMQNANTVCKTLIIAQLFENMCSTVPYNQLSSCQDFINEILQLSIEFTVPAVLDLKIEMFFKNLLAIDISISPNVLQYADFCLKDVNNGYPLLSSFNRYATEVLNANTDPTQSSAINAFLDRAVIGRSVEEAVSILLQINGNCDVIKNSTPNAVYSWLLNHQENPNYLNPFDSQLSINGLFTCIDNGNPKVQINLPCDPNLLSHAVKSYSFDKLKDYFAPEKNIIANIALLDNISSLFPAILEINKSITNPVSELSQNTRKQFISLAKNMLNNGKYNETQEIANSIKLSNVLHENDERALFTAFVIDKNLLNKQINNNDEDTIFENLVTFSVLDSDEDKSVSRNTIEAVLSSSENLRQEFITYVLNNQSNGVIHRDIKPENILLDNDDNKKVLSNIILSGRITDSAWTNLINIPMADPQPQPDKLFLTSLINAINSGTQENAILSRQIQTFSPAAISALFTSINPKITYAGLSKIMSNPSVTIPMLIDSFLNASTPNEKAKISVLQGILLPRDIYLENMSKILFSKNSMSDNAPQRTTFRQEFMNSLKDGELKSLIEGKQHGKHGGLIPAICTLDLAYKKKLTDTIVGMSPFDYKALQQSGATDGDIARYLGLLLLQNKEPSIQNVIAQFMQDNLAVTLNTIVTNIVENQVTDMDKAQNAFANLKLLYGIMSVKTIEIAKQFVKDLEQGKFNNLNKEQFEQAILLLEDNQQSPGEVVSVLLTYKPNNPSQHIQKAVDGLTRNSIEQAVQYIIKLEAIPQGNVPIQRAMENCKANKWQQFIIIIRMLNYIYGLENTPSKEKLDSLGLTKKFFIDYADMFVQAQEDALRWHTTNPEAKRLLTNKQIALLETLEIQADEFKLSLNNKSIDFISKNIQTVNRRAVVDNLGESAIPRTLAFMLFFDDKSSSTKEKALSIFKHTINRPKDSDGSEEFKKSDIERSFIYAILNPQDFRSSPESLYSVMMSVVNKQFDDAINNNIKNNKQIDEIKKIDEIKNKNSEKFVNNLILRMVVEYQYTPRDILMYLNKAGFSLGNDIDGLKRITKVVNENALTMVRELTKTVYGYYPERVGEINSIVKNNKFGTPPQDTAIGKWYGTYACSTFVQNISSQIFFEHFRTNKLAELHEQKKNNHVDDKITKQIELCEKSDFNPETLTVLQAKLTALNDELTSLENSIKNLEKEKEDLNEKIREKIRDRFKLYDKQYDRLAQFQELLKDKTNEKLRLENENDSINSLPEETHWFGSNTLSELQKQKIKVNNSAILNLDIEIKSIQDEINKITEKFDRINENDSPVYHKLVLDQGTKTIDIDAKKTELSNKKTEQGVLQQELTARKELIDELTQAQKSPDSIKSNNIQTYNELVNRGLGAVVADNIALILTTYPQNEHEIDQVRAYIQSLTYNTRGSLLRVLFDRNIPADRIFTLNLGFTEGNFHSEVTKMLNSYKPSLNNTDASEQLKQLRAMIDFLRSNGYGPLLRTALIKFKPEFKIPSLGDFYKQLGINQDIIAEVLAIKQKNLKLTDEKTDNLFRNFSKNHIVRNTELPLTNNTYLKLLGAKLSKYNDFPPNAFVSLNGNNDKDDNLIQLNSLRETIIEKDKKAWIKNIMPELERSLNKQEDEWKAAKRKNLEVEIREQLGKETNDDGTKKYKTAEDLEHAFNKQTQSIEKSVNIEWNKYKADTVEEQWNNFKIEHLEQAKEENKAFLMNPYFFLKFKQIEASINNLDLLDIDLLKLITEQSFALRTIASNELVIKRDSFNKEFKGMIDETSGMPLSIIVSNSIDSANFLLRDLYSRLSNVNNIAEYNKIQIEINTQLTSISTKLEDTIQQIANELDNNDAGTKKQLKEAEELKHALENHIKASMQTAKFLVSARLNVCFDKNNEEQGLKERVEQAIEDRDSSLGGSKGHRYFFSLITVDKSTGSLVLDKLSDKEEITDNDIDQIVKFAKSMGFGSVIFTSYYDAETTLKISNALLNSGIAVKIIVPDSIKHKDIDGFKKFEEKNNKFIGQLKETVYDHLDALKDPASKSGNSKTPRTELVEQFTELCKSFKENENQQKITDPLAVSKCVSDGMDKILNGGETQADGTKVSGFELAQKFVQDVAKQCKAHPENQFLPVLLSACYMDDLQKNKQNPENYNRTCSTEEIKNIIKEIFGDSSSADNPDKQANNLARRYLIYLSNLGIVSNESNKNLYIDGLKPQDNHKDLDIGTIANKHNQVNNDDQTIKVLSRKSLSMSG